MNLSPIRPKTNLQAATRKNLSKLLEKICLSLKNRKKILVAYSGGIDSTLVAKICQITIGKENVLAITAFSPSVAKYDKDNAIEVAKELQLKHLTISSFETEKKAYQKNDRSRCFHCKSHLYGILHKYASENNFQTIANGTNADDLSDYRPGLLAAENFDIVSPLKDFQVTKKTVRELALLLQLPNWDRPASPCLASRVPYGIPIEIKKLSQIEKAEGILRRLDFRNFRVRHHSNIARIELQSADYEKIVDPEIRSHIREEMTALGFSYVCIDLMEFTSGRLNSEETMNSVK